MHIKFIIVIKANLGERQINISIAIVDSDKSYIERISEALQQYEELTVHIYTSADKFRQAAEKNRFDMVLFEPDICEERISFAGVKLPICLCSDEVHNIGMYTEFTKILKYQRISHIYKDMIRAYAEKAGYSAEFDHSQRTSVIAVYSPVGGSGKTTAALALASQLAATGKCVLFVSVEQLDSSRMINLPKEEGLVELIEAAFNEAVNFELKIKGLMKQGIHGISYVEGFGRIADYDAATGDEVTGVLNRIKRCGVCDVVLVDMESRAGMIEKAVLSFADRIVMVERPGELPVAKMELFAEQAIFNEYKSKMVWVYNFAESNSIYSKKTEVPIIGTIHNYGNLKLEHILYAIMRNREIAVDKLRR